MKKTFSQIRSAVIAEQQDLIRSNRLVSDIDLKTLPVQIASYLEQTGAVGKPVLWNADVIWEETSLTLKLDAKPSKMTTRQFLSNNPVSRMMLMKIHGMPFEGLDTYYKGSGRMKGKLLWLFTVMNGEGRDIDISELITIFTEFTILNSLFISENVRYTEIDNNRLKTYFTDNGLTVSGVFTFDDNGLISQFDTGERYRDIGNGKSELTPFRMKIKSYARCGDYFLPKELSIMWIIDGKEFEYFSGTIKDIIFNVTK